MRGCIKDVGVLLVTLSSIKKTFSYPKFQFRCNRSFNSIISSEIKSTKSFLLLLF